MALRVEQSHDWWVAGMLVDGWRAGSAALWGVLLVLTGVENGTWCAG